MKIVKKNPGPALQAFLQSTDKSGQWHGYIFAPADLPGHEEMITPPHHVNGRLHKLKKRSHALAADLAKKAPPMAEGAAFIFPGGVVAGIVRANLHDLCAGLAREAAMDLTRIDDLSVQNVTKFLTPYQNLIAIYEAIADTRRVRGIPFRRDRYRDGVVLVAEDDKFTSSYISAFLKNDYDVVVVRDGEEVVMGYIEYAPHVVLLDIHLPGMDGHKILRTLRTIDPRAYIIMITADEADEQIFQAAKEGADDYLKKPLAKDKLMKAIRLAPEMKKFGSARQ